MVEVYFLPKSSSKRLMSFALKFPIEISSTETGLFRAWILWGVFFGIISSYPFFVLIVLLRRVTFAGLSKKRQNSERLLWY